MPDAFDRLRAALADRYAIERELGRGGMATVHLAEDPNTHGPLVQTLEPRGRRARIRCWTRREAGGDAEIPVLSYPVNGARGAGRPGAVIARTAGPLCSTDGEPAPR